MAKSEILQHLSFRCVACSYPVFIGTHLLHDGALLRQLVGASQVLVVTNTTLAARYLPIIQRAFSDFQCDTVVIPDGESHKNHHSLFAIYDTLIENHHHRDTTLIALGGGVIGDITGFAAATYQRGVRFIQVPTTLLAQVDASIGGKTAINHRFGKNMIGSFYQPYAVLMDVNTLETLPERELRAGFAEIIKYGVLVGGDFLNAIDALLSKGYASITETQQADLIAQCCRIKATFVEEDEREMGQRVLLNLGHTFAHALETYTNYERWLHGEAVAIGLYCAALLSCELGSLKKENLIFIDSLLSKALLPRRIPDEIDVNQLQQMMLSDKKIKNKMLCFVLIKALGDCYLDTEVAADCLHVALMKAVEGEQS